MKYDQISSDIYFHNEVLPIFIVKKNEINHLIEQACVKGFPFLPLLLW
jgi:hypothetical protein